jgi:hypothetical protein
MVEVELAPFYVHYKKLVHTTAFSVTMPWPVTVSRGLVAPEILDTGLLAVANPLSMSKNRGKIAGNIVQNSVNFVLIQLRPHRVRRYSIRA